MKVIYKYPIEIARTQIVRIPNEASVLRVGLDPSGQPCIWAKVDPHNRPLGTTIIVVGTGQSVGDGDNFLGTFVQGDFVWHVFSPTLGVCR